MDWTSRCRVVIPCLNEAAAIGPLVEAVRRHLPDVWVIDDGSTDDTGDCARRAGACVLRHDRPRGKGAALTAGWNRARQDGLAWTLSLDGDGQHSPADIPTFLRRAEETGADLVVGDRMAAPAGMPWLRRQVNRWMSRRLSRLAGCALPDTQNGFRLMRLEPWARLPVHSVHFEIESEILWQFARAGHRIVFVPVQVIYRDERSKIRPWQDTRRWLRWYRRARHAAER